MKKPRGVIVPVVTPLMADRSIDEEGVCRLTEFLLSAGVHGIFALGSSGEFPSLRWSTQLAALKAFVRSVRGRVPVFAGVSSNCVEQVVSRASDAADAGADCAVALTPWYFRTSQAELVAFFHEIADRSPLPVAAYNIPLRTNHNLENVLAIADHPNVVAIKDTVDDFARTLAVIDALRGRDDFAYLHGNEKLALPAALHGADGCVVTLANIVPGFLVEAWERASSGDTLSVAAAQRRIAGLMPVFGLLEEKPQDSTTLRLLAIKGVLQEYGLIRAYMAQLASQPDENLLAPVRRFVAQHGLLEEVEVIR